MAKKDKKDETVEVKNTPKTEKKKVEDKTPKKTPKTPKETPKETKETPKSSKTEKSSKKEKTDSEKSTKRVEKSDSDSEKEEESLKRKREEPIPKKTSGYLLFCAAERKEISTKDNTPTEVMKILGERWQNLDEKKKEVLTFFLNFFRNSTKKQINKMKKLLHFLSNIQN
jgi:hypothetical protein